MKTEDGGVGDGRQWSRGGEDGGVGGGEDGGVGVVKTVE